MARRLGGERRQAHRVPPELTPWKPMALLRPGQEVTVINLSRGGALVTSGARMLPGGRAELQLGGATRASIRGRIDRCRIVALRPLRYEAVIVFEHGLEFAVRLAKGSDGNGE